MPLKGNLGSFLPELASVLFIASVPQQMISNPYLHLHSHRIWDSSVVFPHDLPTFQQTFFKMVLSRQLFIPQVFEHLWCFTSSCKTASTLVSSEAKTTGTGLPLESSESRC